MYFIKLTVVGEDPSSLNDGLQVLQCSLSLELISSVSVNNHMRHIVVKFLVMLGFEHSSEFLHLFLGSVREK